MTDRIELDYYYGSEADQFTFYRLPKVLFTDQRFKSLSSDAKILYGIMLDRMSLSIKNQWIDKEGRVYIIFTLENVMEVFSCSERKAGYLMKELDSKSGIGLIEKKRQGLGKPNLIYVKNFIAASSSPDGGKEDVKSHETGKNGQVKNGKNVPVQSGNIVRVKNCKELPPNNTDINKTEYSETIYQSDNVNETEQNGLMDEIGMYRKLVKMKIEYDHLKEKLSYGECGYLDEILDLIVETISIPCKTIRIGSKEHPYQLVKAKLLKLNALHVEYVIDCLQKTTNKIRNIKSYLLTMLYNAPTTLNSYYCIEVNYDTHNEYAV